MLPAFELVRRLRPVEIVSATTATHLPGGTHRLPRPAPSAALTAPVRGLTTLEFRIGGHRWLAHLDPERRRSWLEVHSVDAAPRRIRSRRHGRPARGRPITHLGFTLTGHHLALLTRQDDAWQIRARADLRDLAPDLDPHDEATLQRLEVTGPDGLVAGGFGHLGLRDIRWVTRADGSPVRDGEHLLLTATHAGPGFFDTAHTGTWRFHPTTHDLAHVGDLYFRRPGKDGRPGCYADHATHLVRHEDRWLVATSTWSDFDLDDPRISTVLARTSTEVTRGEHLLDAEPLVLPVEGIDSRGVWDPHLVHDGTRWLVAYVSARSFFSFHPVLAAGEDLSALTLLGADTTRRACEGVTLVPPEVSGAGWQLLASDGPEAARNQRQQYPVFDLSVQQVGTLSAPHPSNIPWPNLLRAGEEWLLVTFDGTPSGGRLVGYGTHGDVLVMVGADSSAPRSTRH